MYGQMKDKDSLVSILDDVREDLRRVSTRLSARDKQPTLVSLVGGSLDDGKLHVLRTYPDASYRDIFVGASSFVERDGALTIFDWKTGAKVDAILSPSGSSVNFGLRLGADSTHPVDAEAHRDLV
jgi:hypothetical protein